MKTKAEQAQAAVAAMDPRERDTLLIGWLCASAPDAVLDAVRELGERRAPRTAPGPCAGPGCDHVSHAAVTA